MEALLLYALAGIFAGLVAGLFGVGGGLIIVPTLIVVFEAREFNPELIVHLAVGTSLASIVFTSLSSVRAHHRHGAVLWPWVGKLALGILPGAWLGAVLASLLPAEWLGRLFGLFELAVAARMILDHTPAPGLAAPPPGGGELALAGGLIGGFSALLGIGGGTLTVPYLVWRRVAMPNAVAISAACGLPIALAGALGFMITGWNLAELPPMSSGFIYWPALLGVMIFSMACAPLGARLAHHLPPALLKKLFAALLGGLGLKMLFG